MKRYHSSSNYFHTSINKVISVETCNVIKQSQCFPAVLFPISGSQNNEVELNKCLTFCVRVTVYHAAIGNHVLLYSLQPPCRLDYVENFVQQKFWDSPECKISCPHIQSFINKTEIKRPKKVELEDRRNMWVRSEPNPLDLQKWM